MRRQSAKKLRRFYFDRPRTSREEIWANKLGIALDLDWGKLISNFSVCENKTKY